MDEAKGNIASEDELRARFSGDISLGLARAAHDGTSFVPEQRADQERDGYAQQLAEDYANLAKVSQVEPEILDEEFERYRAGYRARYTKHLGSRARCMSVMITGPSNFPGRRNAKRNEVADKRLSELLEYRERALQAIRRTIRPGDRPIMAGDDNATERLQEKIEKAEKWQARMKELNAVIRKHAKGGVAAQAPALVAAGISEASALKLLTQDFCGRIGFPAYELTNNQANIRRMKERLQAVAESKGQPETSLKGENATLEDSPSDNRIRLFFPGKPTEEIRTRLKSQGFRWTPSLGCWQAYRNYNSIELAKEIARQGGRQ